MSSKPAKPAKPAADATDAPPKKKGKTILVLVPVLLAATVGGGWLGVSRATPAAATEEAAAEEAAHEEEDETPPAFSELQGIVVNPAGTDGQRYLLVNAGFEAKDPAVVEELGAREIVVRDAIVGILSRRTVPELADVGQRDALKAEILAAVNEAIREGEVTRFYFTQYVLQ